jgi:ADP-ribose pyrophosphatase YjhB (NUDIX family)
MSSGREYPLRPVVGVGVVVWHGERVLMVRRGRPPRVGQWSLPGGAQELGETVAAAACREVLEETGLEIEVGEVLATVDMIERDGERVRYHYTLIDFSAEATSAELRAGGDAADARWFAPAEVEELGLWTETVRIIELARTRRPSCR